MKKIIGWLLNERGEKIEPIYEASKKVQYQPDYEPEAEMDRLKRHKETPRDAVGRSEEPWD